MLADIAFIFLVFPALEIAAEGYINRRLLPDGEWKVYAPWGFQDILNLVVRPNPASGNKTLYENKAARWKGIWPGLTIIPWPHSPTDIEPR